MSQYEDLFYHDISPEVKQELDARRVAGAPNRSTHTHNWNMGKVATAVVWTTDETGKRYQLATPSDGGFESLYTDKTTYAPNPIITSITIKDEGPLGTLRKMTVNFELFTREQLNTYDRVLLSPGRELNAEWGWSNYAGNKTACRGGFTGRIYNFNWSAKTDGGFNCVVDVVGPGQTVLGIDINAAADKVEEKPDTLSSSEEARYRRGQNIDNIPTEDTTPQSPSKQETPTSQDAGDTELPIAVTLMTQKIQEEINKLVQSEELSHGDVFNFLSLDSLVVFDMGDDTSDANTNETNSSDGEDVKSTPLDWYITLELLFKVINDPLLKTTINRPENKIRFVCDENTSRSYSDTHLRSSHPEHIILPGPFTGDYTKYVDIPLADGTTKPHRSQSNSKQFFPTNVSYRRGATYGDASKILVNWEWFKEELATIEKFTIKAFTKKIFAYIAKYTGGFIRLGLALKPIKSETPPYITSATDLLVVDTEYVSLANKVQPYRFDAFSATSIVRSLNMSCKLPNEYAAVAYIRGKTGGVVPNHVGRIVRGEKKPETADQKKERIAARDEAAETIEKLASVIAKKETSNSVRMDFESALKKYRTNYHSQDTSTPHVNTSLKYPISLSLTIDGIDGLRFGDIITSSNLPDKYKEPPEIVFMITTIEQSITPHDWTTTINTQCRVAMV